jgi:hypothetical protein
MNRLLLGFAFVAALAVSVHARTPSRIEPANWTVAGSPELQSAGVHSMVGFHALHAGF